VVTGGAGFIGLGKARRYFSDIWHKKDINIDFCPQPIYNLRDYKILKLA